MFLWSGLAHLVVHQTLGRGVLGSILSGDVVCCGLEQVTFPQLNVYSVHMFLNSRNKSSVEFMLVVEIMKRLEIKIIIIIQISMLFIYFCINMLMFLCVDESMVSKDLQRILERVRQSADFMPAWQMEVCQTLPFTLLHLSLDARKPVFGVSDQVRHKPACTSSEKS